ncbi:MAG: sigma-70 family RNA polymerase sigma factor [Ruminococcaceae bacterium]|nr:sigma-70 family RNA polymerase sigma factor [Oscillospiraceae bacterium]
MVTSVFYPKQLKPEEEDLLVVKCAAGDIEARNILIEHNLRLVAHIAKKYSNTGYSSDDLISIGSIGLIKAVSSYKPDKGTKLGTYAVRCISNEILMFLRADKKHQSDISLQDSVGKDSEGNEITFMELLSTDDSEFIEEIENEMNHTTLRQRVNQLLKGREKTIIDLRYGLSTGVERTQKEIGKMLGISRSYVSRIEKSALKKLRIALE